MKPPPGVWFPGEAPPRWDLSDLYPGMQSAELEGDLRKARKMGFSFQRAYAGFIRDCDAATLGAALADYEAMETLTARLVSYAELLRCCDLESEDKARFKQRIDEAVGSVGSLTDFLLREINEIESNSLSAMLRHPDVARFAPWVRAIREFRPYQLSIGVEDLFEEKRVTADAWKRLYKETISSLRFRIRGEDLTQEQAFVLITDADRDLRQEVSQAVGNVFVDNARLLSLIANTICRDEEISRRLRGFDRPDSPQHLENQVEAEVVDALVDAVSGAYSRLSHRYYAMKARWLGLDRLEFWDRMAPLPGNDRTYSWSEAVRIVVDSLAAFSPEMAVVANRFFANGWIDAEPRPGKERGGFAHPASMAVHPYLMVNYHGRMEDVTVLAHEVGHGIHMTLAAGQGQLMFDAPTPLAETASLFGEMLAFQSLLRKEDDPARRRWMIAGKVEDMLDTCTRQMAFHQFEMRMHEERESGEITPDRLAEMWLDAQRESLGPALRFDDSYRHFWATIEHFFDTPFYVYSYSFGNCLVNSLYDVYLKEPEGFEEKYLDLLRAGGSKRHRELLAPFGLDATDPGFWEKGLGVIEDLLNEIDDLERS